MRAGLFLLAAALTAGQAGCAPAGLAETLPGRWQAVDQPGLSCEFTEDGTIRMRGDFGQAVGAYGVDETDRGWLHWHPDRPSGAPVFVNASVARGTLLLQDADGGSVRFRRR